MTTLKVYKTDYNYYFEKSYKHWPSTKNKFKLKNPICVCSIQFSQCSVLLFIYTKITNYIKITEIFICSNDICLLMGTLIYKKVLSQINSCVIKLIKIQTYMYYFSTLFFIKYLEYFNMATLKFMTKDTQYPQ